MATRERYTNDRPTGMLKLLICLCIVAWTGVMLLAYGPVIKSHLPSLPAIPTTAAGGYPASAPRPTKRAIPTVPPVVNPGGSFNDQAAADAAFATAVAAGMQQPAAPIPNQNNTGDVAPIETGEKLIVREHNVENVPTSEPIIVQPADDQTGEKQKPVNIQETHQCLHGQIWVDGRGCKNPTPVR